ncbi:hypothetical protein AB0B50_40250 [Streptomyces sp. NPDC041068]|uniref:hypothetical protein n=1 Tax=Streptomyces sp. NPDC041068 TaxID=3155130 RepID=UPI0033F42C71
MPVSASVSVLVVPGHRAGSRRAARPLVVTACSLLLALSGVTAFTGPAYAAETTCTVNGKNVTSARITGTDGADIIVCDHGVPQGVTVDGGAGADTIIATGTQGHSGSHAQQGGVGNSGEILGGAGSDSITVTGGSGGDVRTQKEVPYDPSAAPGGVGNNGRIQGGAGEDEITVTGGLGGADKDGGSAENASALHGDNAFLGGGEGDDRILIKGAGRTTAVSGSQIHGGRGADSIEIRSTSPNRTALQGTKVFGDGGDDVIHVSGGTGWHSVLAGGEGNDRLSVTGNYKFTANDLRSQMLGGPGDDILMTRGGPEEDNRGIVDGGDGHNICYVPKSEQKDQVKNCERIRK